MTIVPDCGMGPGLNISLATYVMELVEKPEEVLIWDGGLPQDPQEPWNYVSTFNLGGLTNEYDGNAFFLRDGQVTPVPCFSGYEVLEFPAPLGRLEAFVTSGGLSTSPWTFEGRLKRLENKTLRYPGHVAQFKAFSDLGLLGLDPIDVGRPAGRAARRLPRAARAADLPQRGEGRLRDAGEGHRHDEGQARRGHGRTRGSLRREDRLHRDAAAHRMARFDPADRRGEPDGPARRGVGGALPARARPSSTSASAAGSR